MRTLTPTLLRQLTAGIAALFLITQIPGAGGQTNEPVEITAGADWIPLQTEREIEPGSALDFSGIAGTDAPAGKHGRVLAGQGGHFVFADSPAKPRRFYGVNFCFSALYLSHEEADATAERLARLGYNALRIHHYENELSQRQTNSMTFNPQKLEQLDYFVAALIRHGIYLTTDLFVSRSMTYREIGVDRDGRVPMDTYKVLVPVHEGAFENWKAFSRALLSHTNPYTHRTYAQEPALAWLAMINEGNFGNFFKDIVTTPEWNRAWNRWLVTRYGARAMLASAWGAELKDTEDPGSQTVALPENLHGNNLRTRDCIAFLADTDQDMVLRMKAFLRYELGCQALVSNSSSWTRFITDQGSRAIYDYVDDHFYVDHPRFIEAPWRLPSRCANANPIAEGAPGGRPLAFTRLLNKPFTVTEYNYSGPGRFRGVGGILTGALGALQDWGGIWRFAFSHSRAALGEPTAMGYFDVASDPLSQAAERASLCLFARGDIEPAPHSVALVMTRNDLARPASRIPTLAPNWHWLAWVTRVGTEVVDSAEQPLPYTAVIPLGWQTPGSAYRRNVLNLEPYTVDNPTLLVGLASKHVFSDAPEPSKKFLKSETGQLTIDGPQGQLLLDTPRTAGGYAAAGRTIEAKTGGVRAALSGSDATVWVSALDKYPIRRSERLLVTHLTDLQNSGIRYAEPARQTLLDWGHLPHLVRAGKAEVSVRLRNPAKFHVWALTTSGKRLAEVPAAVTGENLNFTADVAGGGTAGGARMLYEIALK